MIFDYTRVTDVVYLSGSDEYEEFGDGFQYEVDDERICKAVAKLASERYFGTDKYAWAIKIFIEDCEILEKVADFFYEELKELFEAEAMEN